MKLLAGYLNGFTYSIVGLFLFGFIGCGIDFLTGDDTIFIRGPESNLADVRDATLIGRILMLVWLALAFGFGMHRFYSKDRLTPSNC